MKIKVEINETELCRLILTALESKLGDVKVTESMVRIEVKSKQNYKSEWESAAFRAIYEGDV